jgi:hypothetical protein
MIAGAISPRRSSIHEPNEMAIVLCPVCKGKCLCVACDGRMEIYNEGQTGMADLSGMQQPE